MPCCLPCPENGDGHDGAHTAPDGDAFSYIMTHGEQADLESTIRPVVVLTALFVTTMREEGVRTSGHMCVPIPPWRPLRSSTS